MFLNNADKSPAEIEFDYQLFLGKWKVTDMIPIETVIPSIFSGFDENDNLRGQDLIDNILGQEIFFGRDYIENQGKIYKISEKYKIDKILILSEDMIIGSTSAKTLDITGEFFYVVYFSLPSMYIKKEGNRDFTSLNQLYLKDTNTIYASVGGFLTFELKREEIKAPLDK